MTVHQPGDRARRVPADLLHRQGCRYASGDAVKGPSDSDCIEDSGKLAGAVRRQSCGRACDPADGPGDQACQDPTDSMHRRGCRCPCGDATTGPSFSDYAEDGVSPAGAVHRQSGHACDQAEEIIHQKRIPERVVGQIDDVPVPQILNEIVEVVKAVKNVPQERISEEIGEQIVDAPVSHSQPQILKEVVEVVKAVKNVPQEHISEKIGEQIDDDIVPVDQPGDQARRDPQACGVATTGPSGSDCIEDSGNPDQPGDQACQDPADSTHRQGCCRSACGNATTGPSDSDSVDNRGRPADAVRWLSYGGADGMRQVACPKCGCLTTCVEDDACDECGEYSHIRECAACIWYACARCTEAAQAAKLPWEARRRRGRGRHWC